jgi:hypothetical protein
LDDQVLPLLRDIAEGVASPEARAFEYNSEKWELAMDWLERRAAMDLLHGLKAAEPPLSDTEAHASWQYHYDKFKERVLGFIKLRASGIVSDPETVYFVIQLFSRINDFSKRALGFLEVKERPHLGEAERPLETEVTLAERNGD